MVPSSSTTRIATLALLLLPLHLLLFPALASIKLDQPLSPIDPSRQAYLTLVVQDKYVLGARVLGHSIKASGTTRDLAMIVTPYVSQVNRDLLRQDGWILFETPIIANPYFVRRSNKAREEAQHDLNHASVSELTTPKVTFTKLQAWNWTLLGGKYDKVIYMDADVVVMKNVDHLFECAANMCAVMGKAYKTLWNFNGGVLVLSPNDEMAQNLWDSLSILSGSTRKGEASHLNRYFLHYCNQGKLIDRHNVMRSTATPYSAVRYNPSKPKDTQDFLCATLPGEYNLRWPMQCGSQVLGTEVRAALYNDNVMLLHFQGALKPWHWRNYFFHGWFWYWQSHAAQVNNLYAALPSRWSTMAMPVLVSLSLVLFGYVSLRWRIPIALERRLRALGVFVQKRPNSWQAVVIAGILPPIGCLWMGHHAYTDKSFIPQEMPFMQAWCTLLYWMLVGWWGLSLPYLCYHFLLGIRRAKMVNAVLYAPSKSGGGDDRPWTILMQRFAAYTTTVATIIVGTLYFMLWVLGYVPALLRLVALGVAGTGLCAFSMMCMSSMPVRCYNAGVVYCMKGKRRV